jgi:hypothetical protein
MANLELREFLNFAHLFPKRYDNYKTTSRCEAEHQKRG